MQRLAILAGGLGLFLQGIACGSSSAPPEVDVSGLWIGTVSSPQAAKPFPVVADALQDGGDLRLAIEVAAEEPLDFMGIYGNNLGVEVEGRVSGRVASFSYEEQDIDTGMGVRIEGRGSPGEGGSGAGTYSARGIGGATLPVDDGAWSGNLVAGLSLPSTLMFALDAGVDSATSDGTRLWIAGGFKDAGGSGCSKVCPLDAQGELGTCILDQCGALPPDSFPWCREALVYAEGEFWCFDDQGKIYEVSLNGLVLQTLEAPADLRGSSAIVFDGNEFVSASYFQLCRFDRFFSPLGCQELPFFATNGLVADRGTLWLLGGFPHKLYHLDTVGKVLAAADLPAETGITLQRPAEEPPPEQHQFPSDLAIQDGALVVPAVAMGVSGSSTGFRTTFYRIPLP
jgi:hypothetical protein